MFASTPWLVVKRLIDIIISLFFIIILLPFLFFAGVAIKIDSRGPVFFVQKRIGRKGAPFDIIKFRTMIPDAQSQGAGLDTFKGDRRITRVGRILREWSLDELPQLFNVLKGDMSIVGPRPALPSQVEKYLPYQWVRLEVRPGITGWAQVNGRNLLSMEDRIKHDIWYVENRSLLLDARILAKTILVVLRRQGIYERYESPEMYTKTSGGDNE